MLQRVGHGQGRTSTFAASSDPDWRAEAARRAAAVPEVDDDNFLGVVRAIAAEVAQDQKMLTEELMGEAHFRCREALERFDPTLCSTFAHYAFKTVKRSMIRDISRSRRKDIGLNVDGGVRPSRKHSREVIGGEVVVRNGYGGEDGGLATGGGAMPARPEWWPRLSERQQSIALLMAAKTPLRKIALYVGLTGPGGEATVADEVRAIRLILVDIGEASEDDLEQAEETERERSAPRKGKADNAKGAGSWTTTRAA